MKKVLILTKEADAHSLAVAVAITRMGHLPQFWITKFITTRQTHTLNINRNFAGEERWFAKGFGVDWNAEPAVTVWHRRPQFPTLAEEINVEDVIVAEREVLAGYHSLISTIHTGATWVNDSFAARKAGYKPLQLVIAQKVGLRIPPTIISNDPGEIREFAAANQGIGGTIYKTFRPASWIEGKGQRVARTAIVRAENLVSDEMLKSVLGIYQRNIEKNFEVRITAIGKRLFGAKLLSQQHEKGAVDWRIIPDNELIIVPYDIPDDIYKKCLDLMSMLGIVFGCIDLIVAPSGEIIFLEINEQGQFLWVEDACPEMRLLEYFAHFLINGDDKNFSQTPDTNLSWSNISASPDFQEMWKKSVADSIMNRTKAEIAGQT
jgi:glutathione synthase/RimK-type ligase-like ATP-grasp enzyme